MVAPESEAREAAAAAPPPPPAAPPLSGPTLAAVAEHVANLRQRLGREPRVVALLGAGASASAGLPDWRSPDSGLYAAIRARAEREGDAELAACPGLAFSLSHFRRDPSAFYRVLREHCLWPGPTTTTGGEEEEQEQEQKSEAEEEHGGAGAKGRPREREGEEEEEDEEDAGGAAAGDQDDGENVDPAPQSGSKRRERAAAAAPPILPPAPPRPTAAHCLLAALERRGALLRAYTQNVDGLEFSAGCSDGTVVQAHGGFREAHCAACGGAASPYAVMEALAGAGEEEEEQKEGGGEGGDARGKGAAAEGGAGPRRGAPRCASCGERAVKPAVVLFGERLPARFHRLRLRDMPQCELLLVLGTALAVEPFASLLGAPPPSCPRVLVNRCAVRLAEEEGEGGFAFGSPKGEGCRDVAVLGECDDGCLALAEALGGEEMRREVERAWRSGGVGGGGVFGGEAA